jgi:hypothetical protein
MKKQILLLIALIGSAISNHSIAQNSRTIEVTVSDTVFLRTTKITYKLVLDTTMAMWNEFDEGNYEYSEEEYIDTEYSYEPEPTNKKNKRKQKEEQEIIEVPVIEEEIVYDIEPYVPYHYMTKQDMFHLLDSCKFNYEVFDNGNYEIGGQPIPLTFLLILTNEEDLKRVQQTFSGRQELTGSVKEMEFESAESKMAVVYKDLYAKAQKEAQLLAKLGGLTVDKLHKVYEQKSELDNYLSNYEDMMKALNLGLKEPMDFSEPLIA